MDARPPLPRWAETIRRKYLAAESSLFVLHGNVFDALLHEGRFHDLEEFLAEVLLRDNKRNIVCYDPASGLRVRKREQALANLESLVASRAPADVLPALEEVLRSTDATALVLTYASMLAPAASPHLLGHQDRINVVTLHRWSLSPQLTAKDNVVFLVTDLLGELHPQLVSNPRVAAVEVPLPDVAARREVVRHADPSLSAAQAEVLARHTAGLKSLQIRSLLAPRPGAPADVERRERLVASLLEGEPDAEARARKLAALTRGMGFDEIRHLIRPGVGEPASDAAPHAEVLELVHRRKREIIEKECHGLIEFVDGGADFSEVGGYDDIKTELLAIAGSIRAGERSRVPMGLLFVGPMGTGKTFVAGAFARASGLTAVKLKNVRSKWVGATEANLDKVLGMVRALGPIILIIDEGERALSGSGDSDGGTSSRLIARLKEFMSDPSNRGHVLFIVMTNRPDKLDTDIKRAGRLDRKIPFFYAGEPGHVASVLQAVARRHRLDCEVDWAAQGALLGGLVGWSNADLEAVMLLAHELAGDGPVTAAVLEQAAADYMPSRDTPMLEYMELLAVFEASRRSLLPEKYRHLSPDALAARLQQMRLTLGGRV